MIRMLQGQISHKDERTIILFVNGVGYHVFVPNSILDNSENETTLFVHTHVREDALNLYGFRTKNELNFFEMLLTVTGIGPKVAMDMMNQAVDQIQNAIISSDVTLLTHIPGIGKKTAERLILELKSKIEPGEFNDKGSLKTFRKFDDDVIFALENLGYKRSHIQKVLSSVQESTEEALPNKTEEWIRMFLQRV